MVTELYIRNMTRAEVDELVEWAAREGWNPGLHDAELFWHTDSEAFIAAEREGELIGGGAITSYEGRFGFMGFFIVRPEHRGKGLGNRLWHARRERMINRLRPGAAVGLDGVLEMQDYYAKGGFVLSHRDIRFQSTGAAAATGAGIVSLSQVSFQQLLDYDTACFPAPRARFLHAWVTQPDSLALGALKGTDLAGYGVIRRCREGCKVGPLFADDKATAEALFDALAGFASAEPVYLDVPENNPGAMALAARRGMRQVFACARMYLGPAPALPMERIFGVTTFELG
jgi:GNAT superfamily N-acetyltransferase